MSIVDSLKKRGATGSNIAECIETLPSSEGGSSLPEVTSEDEGAVLKVVNGQWDAALETPIVPVIVKLCSNNVATSSISATELYSKCEEGYSYNVTIIGQDNTDYSKKNTLYPCAGASFELSLGGIEFTVYAGNESGVSVTFYSNNTTGTIIIS